MTVLFRCSACQAQAEGIKSSGDCLVPPKGWAIVTVRSELAEDDDGKTGEWTSNEAHLCPRCEEATDVDAMLARALPVPS